MVSSWSVDDLVIKSSRMGGGVVNNAGTGGGSWLMWTTLADAGSSSTVASAASPSDRCDASKASVTVSASILLGCSRCNRCRLLLWWKSAEKMTARRLDLAFMAETHGDLILFSFFCSTYNLDNHILSTFVPYWVSGSWKTSSGHRPVFVPKQRTDNIQH